MYSNTVPATSYRRDVIRRTAARKLVGKMGKTGVKNVPSRGDGQQFRGHSPAIDNYCRGCSDAAVIGAIFSGAALLVKLNKNFHS